MVISAFKPWERVFYHNVKSIRVHLNPLAGFVTALSVAVLYFFTSCLEEQIRDPKVSGWSILMLLGSFNDQFTNYIHSQPVFYLLLWQIELKTIDEFLVDHLESLPAAVSRPTVIDFRLEGIEMPQMNNHIRISSAIFTCRDRQL